MTSPVAVTVDASGIHAPTYAQILSYLIAQYQAIYGSDAYLQPDSQDGQLLAVFANAINDVNAAAIAVYNSFSPVTAQGAGLSSNVKLNGIARMSSSNSTVTVTITGTAGTTITNGIVADTNNNQWKLPAIVVIPNAGTINVTATAVNTGNIAAAPSTVTTIVTAVYGWQTVTNPGSATPGNPIETDAQLRVRQATAASLPSQTINAGIFSSIAALAGVTRLALYENFTDNTDSNTLPPHSLCLVVQGGDPNLIAQTIALKKSEGCNTYGTTSVIVTDQITGIPATIKFYIPTQVAVSMIVYLKALNGYIAATGTAVVAALAAYVNALSIGATLYNSKLVGAADDSGFGSTFNILNIYQARADMAVIGGPYAAAATVINITRATDIAVGTEISITLDNNTQLQANVSNVAGTAITFAPAIPGGRTVQNGALIYTEGDITSAFNELLTGSTSNIILVQT